MIELQRRVLELEQQASHRPAPVSAPPTSRLDGEHIVRPVALERSPVFPRAVSPIRRQRSRPVRRGWSVDLRWGDLRLVAMIAVGVLATLTLVSLVLLAAAAYL
jgi:hypothetical protein